MGLFSSFGSSNSQSFNNTVAKSVKLRKDQNGAGATDLNTIEAKGGLDLRKKSEAVSVSLKKYNVEGIRAQVVLVLDHSGSMYQDYENGTVQNIAERFLAFGLQVDEDGTIPVIPFDSSVKNTVDVNIDNYKDIVKSRIYNRNGMGSTNLTDALKAVRKIAESTEDPIFCAIVTDGEPNDRSSATEVVKDLSRYPVFLKFIAIQNVRYLQDLDDLPDSERLLDNVDAKFFQSINSVSDSEFADAMAEEWDSWTKKATEKGVLS